MQRIRTTSVGSWPIPFGQRPVLKEFYAGKVTEGAAQDALSAAARIAMDEQLACGIDQITGGEVFAPDFVHHIPPQLGGLETLAARDPARGYEGIGKYRICGDISAPAGIRYARAYRRERRLEPNLSKVCLPSPHSIALSFLDDPLLDTQLENLSRVIDAEIADVVDAGVEEIQIDAPVEAIALANSKRSVGFFATWLNRAFACVPGEVRKSVHFCLGDISRRAATEHQNLRSLLPLIQALDSVIDSAHIECSHAGQWAEHSLLGDIPDSMAISAGIADVKNEPESVDKLRRKIDAMLKVIPPERLSVSSSCGCGRVPHDQAIRLMRNLVKASAG